MISRLQQKYALRYERAEAEANYAWSVFHLVREHFGGEDEILAEKAYQALARFHQARNVAYGYKPLAGPVGKLP